MKVTKKMGGLPARLSLIPDSLSILWLWDPMSGFFSFFFLDCLYVLLTQWRADSTLSPV